MTCEVGARLARHGGVRRLVPRLGWPGLWECELQGRQMPSSHTPLLVSRKPDGRLDSPRRIPPQVLRLAHKYDVRAIVEDYVDKFNGQNDWTPQLARTMLGLADELNVSDSLTVAVREQAA